MWAPGLKGVHGNEIANSFARKGANLLSDLNKTKTKSSLRKSIQHGVNKQNTILLLTQV